MLKKKNIKFYIILVGLIIHYYYFDNVCLNQNGPEMEIICLIERYLDPLNIPILNKQELLIKEYWGDVLCPFSKLRSRGLSMEEAFLLIDFFNITVIEDLKKLEEFIKK